MELDHEFTVPVPVDRAWPVLLDVERVAPCMPGATLDDIDGDEFTGRLKVKVGPITVTYRGSARFASKDDQANKVTIEGSGKETRGAGTASATVDAQLHENGDQTRVTVHTNLNVTGRPAQFGRNVMSEVGAKLVGQFADCLASELAAPSPAVAEGAPSPEGAPASEVTPSAGTTGAVTPAEDTEKEDTEKSAPASGAAARARHRPSADAIDLLDVAGGPILRRALPAVGAVIVIVGIILLIRRLRQG